MTVGGRADTSGWDRRHLVILAGLVLFVALPFVGDAYVLRVATRIMILAMVAISLDILIGYSGLISFGHAMFLGVGGYLTGILALNGIENAFAAWAIAIAGSALLAVIVGLIVLKTTGVYFIMITMAFAQMLFYVAQSLTRYGGDDGLLLSSRNSFFGLIDPENPVVFHYVVLILLAAILYVSYRLVNSRFGRVLQAARDNERRVRSLGYNTYRYRLAAFAISGAIAGFAGALSINLQKFVSPPVLEWVTSGDLLIMVIVGGANSLVGPIIGTGVFVLLEEVISGYTKHWMIIFGPLLLVVVLFGRQGIWGLIRPRRARDG